MSKMYYFGANRSIIVNKREYGYFITICDFDRVTITMPSKRWSRLLMFRDAVDISLTENTEMKRHMGGAFYICAKDQRVQIRRFYYNEEKKEERPTKEGIVLNQREWGRIKEIADIINDEYTDIAFELPCFAESDHQNQLGMLACYECNPFQLNL
jgi:Transcriptional Coactivator p15 (PC4)